MMHFQVKWTPTLHQKKDPKKEQDDKQYVPTLDCKNFFHIVVFSLTFCFIFSLRQKNFITTHTPLLPSLWPLWGHKCSWTLRPSLTSATIGKLIQLLCLEPAVTLTLSTQCNPMMEYKVGQEKPSQQFLSNPKSLATFTRKKLSKNSPNLITL